MFDQSMQGNMMNGGANYNYNYNGFTPEQAVKVHNTLTPEEIDTLMAKEGQFSLQMTRDEYLKGICNHRSKDGTHDMLVFDPTTGEARCAICGYKFRPIDASVNSDTIKEAVENIIDILQTIKIMYIDLPAEASKEFMQIIPLIGKIPQLFEFAVKNTMKHEDYNWRYRNMNMGSMAMLNNLESLFSGTPMMNQQYYGNPNMAGMNWGGYPGAMGGAMNMPQQPPMGNMVPPNGAVQPNPAAVSPFGYPGASMNQAQNVNPAFTGGYNPNTPNGYSYNPNDPNRNNAVPAVPATTPPANTGNSETTVTKDVTI